MTRHFGVVRVGLLLLCALPLMAQKKAPQQAIRFQGATQYTQQQLLAAAGLKADTRASAAQVKAAAKQLDDSGLFKEVRFTATANAAVFTLTPTTQLYPMRLDNVPVTAGNALDDTLHARFPLYGSMLPTHGSMVDGICRTLEQMLAAKGVKATVKAALTSGVGAKKITAVNFSVASPAVHIGRIQLVGVGPAMMANASLVATGQTGNDFDTEATAIGLQHVFEDLYQGQDYAAAQVDVAEVDPLVVTEQSVDVPYMVTIKEGGVYKLGSIDYPAGALVTRADVQKLAAKYPANSGRPLDQFVQSVHDAYNARGYLDCAVVLHPTFNEATHIANYGLEVVPGAQYKLAAVKFDGAPDAMAAKLKLAWKVPPGGVFDESLLANFAALAQKKDKVLAKWMQTVITTYDYKADATTHTVNCVFHFAKAS